jgi:NADH-quinone oxidoreductase subunit L
MLVPMVILAVLSVGGGYAGLPKVLGLGNAIDEFLQPVFAGSTQASLGEGTAASQWLVIGVSIVETALAFALAWWLYIRKWGMAERWTESARGLYDLIYNKYYVDRAYDKTIVKPLRRVAGILSSLVEDRGIDAAVDSVGRLVGLASEGLKRLQTGLVRNYALALLAGAVLLVLYFVARSVLG